MDVIEILSLVLGWFHCSSQDWWETRVQRQRQLSCSKIWWRLTKTLTLLENHHHHCFGVQQWSRIWEVLSIHTVTLKLSLKIIKTLQLLPNKKSHSKTLHSISCKNLIDDFTWPWPYQYATPLHFTTARIRIYAVRIQKTQAMT